MMKIFLLHVIIFFSSETDIDIEWDSNDPINKEVEKVVSSENKNEKQVRMLRMIVCANMVDIRATQLSQTLDEIKKLQPNLFPMIYEKIRTSMLTKCYKTIPFRVAQQLYDAAIRKENINVEQYVGINVASYSSPKQTLQLNHDEEYINSLLKWTLKDLQEDNLTRKYAKSYVPGLHPTKKLTGPTWEVLKANKYYSMLLIMITVCSFLIFALSMYRDHAAAGLIKADVKKKEE